MKKGLLILLCLPFIGFGQNVNIPDANFKAFLVGNTAINTNGDAEIQVSEATAFNGTIDCNNMNISDLTGIEDFIALTGLICYLNQLTSLDVSANTALTNLQCHNQPLVSLDLSNNIDLNTLVCTNNQLTSLDLSNNTNLIHLQCQGNSLTILDVSANTALEHLACPSNQITNLDVSNNTVLTYLWCDVNQLTSLDVRNGNNTSFTVFSATTNPNLYCIDVDDPVYSAANWWNAQAPFSTNCATAFGCIDILALNFDSTATIDDSSCTYQLTYVPDDNFEQALINLGYDNILDDSVTTAIIDTLTYLSVNGILGSNIYIYDLTGIEDFTALTYLSCGSNQLTSLDLSQNTALATLQCGYNGIGSLNVSNNPALTYLECIECPLSSLDVSANAALTHLLLGNSQLTTLDLSQNTALIELHCGYNTQLTSLDVSNNTALVNLFCSDNSQLTSLDIRNGNNINFTSSLSAWDNPNLFCIDVDDPVWSATNWTGIDAWTSFSSNCATAFGCIDILALNFDSIATINDGSCYYAKTYVPDDNFEAYLEANGMGDGIMLNDSVLTGNITSVVTLYVDFQNISNLTGIETFISLTDLDCRENQLSSLDLSANTALTTLKCDDNQLISLDVSNNIILTHLQCHNNQLTSLDVSNNTALNMLSYYSNQITSIDLSNNTALTSLYCNNNQLTILDLSANTALTKLYCNDNQLTMLDLRNGNNINMINTYPSTIGNPNLYCIDVDDATWSTANWTVIDAWSSFSSNCATAFGCTDSTSCNYNSVATIDDGSCSGIFGCMAGTACNYNPLATCDDGSCVYSNSSMDTVISCDSYYWEGTNYTTSGAYVDTLTNIAGCDSTVTLNLTVNYSSSSASNITDYYICNGQSVTIGNSIYTNPGTYSDTLTANNGCDSTFISIVHVSYLALATSSTPVTCIGWNDGSVAVGIQNDIPPMSIVWNTNDTIATIGQLGIGVYIVQVSDTACVITDTIQVSINVTTPADSMYPEICYITVDSASGNNKVIIKPMANLLTSKFIIYKESSANIYSPIDTVNYNTLEYLDVSSSPMIQSYRYKVSVLDTCGNESVKSDFHKTIHLTMSLGVNGEVNLLWNTYEGYQPSDYLIFRSINNGAMNQIGILPGTNLTYTDLTPPSGILNYQVRAIAPNCNIVPFAKSANNMLTSNVINHSTTPVEEHITNKKILKVTDLLGRETKGTKNEVLFYIYDDGTVEKRIVIE